MWKFDILPLAIMILVYCLKKNPSIISYKYIFQKHLEYWIFPSFFDLYFIHYYHFMTNVDKTIKINKTRIQHNKLLIKNYFKMLSIYGKETL